MEANQRVGITVKVDDTSLSVFDEVDHSTDEVVDGQLRHSAEQWSQVLHSLQRMSLQSPGLLKRSNQEPVEPSPGVQVTRSIQPALAFRRIDKVKVRDFELQSDTTFTEQSQ